MAFCSVKSCRNGCNYRWETQPFMHSWPEANHQNINKEYTVNRTIKKRRVRTAFTSEQLKVLEQNFASRNYIDRELRRELANTLNIGEKSVKIWFQNRRMKMKKETPESSDISSSDCVAYNNISTPSPVSRTQNSYENQHTVNSNIEPTVQKASITQPQSYYPYEDNTWRAFNPTYGIDYQNFPPPPPHYMSYGMASHAYDNFCNDATVYPAQYYPSVVPEYTNMDQSNQNPYQSNQNQSNQSTPSELPNWSASDIDLNYFSTI